MRKLLIFGVIPSFIWVAGCQTRDAYTGEEKVASSTTGSIIGGLAGAVLGNQVKGSKRARQNARLGGAALGALGNHRVAVRQALRSADDRAEEIPGLELKPDLGELRRQGDQQNRRNDAAAEGRPDAQCQRQSARG